MVEPNCCYFPLHYLGVTFKAMQVTKENFGIEIEGIVFWAVHRFADGPFKCYKYTEGSDANENVRQVTESIVRSQISNTTLLNVLRKRVDLREEVTKQLRQQLQGWGIWPETVEITEVRICSSQTFKDMQTEFRFTHKQKAEKARQETKAVLEEEKTKLQLQLQQIQRDISTELKEFQQTQAILRETYQNKFEKEKFIIQKQQLEQNQEIDLLKEDLYQSKQILCKQNALELKEMSFEHKSKEEQKWRDLYNTMNERNLQIEKLQNIQEMYDNMHSLQSVTINKFQGPDSFNHISSAMPAVNLLNQALKP